MQLACMIFPPAQAFLFAIHTVVARLSQVGEPCPTVPPCPTVSHRYGTNDPTWQRMTRPHVFPPSRALSAGFAPSLLLFGAGGGSRSGSCSGAGSPTARASCGNNDHSSPHRTPHLTRYAHYWLPVTLALALALALPPPPRGESVSGAAVGCLLRALPLWSSRRRRRQPKTASLVRPHASGSGTISPFHVAKARLGDQRPGRGGIRPLALTQKPLSHSAGSRASNHAGQIFGGAPCPLVGAPCRYVSGPLAVPGEI